MCMRTRSQSIQRTKTGAYIIGGVLHKVHPKILRAQEAWAKRSKKKGERKALAEAKKAADRGL